MIFYARERDYRNSSYDLDTKNQRIKVKIDPIVNRNVAAFDGHKPLRKANQIQDWTNEPMIGLFCIGLSIVLILIGILFFLKQ